MNEHKEYKDYVFVGDVSDKATKQTEAYKFVKELSEALDIPLMKSGNRAEAPFYYIQENGLSVFTMHHKVAVVYQRDSEADAITNQIFPDKDLKLAVLSAYKDARLEIQKRKEQF
ncbi:hypothetical protein [Aeromonas piscicola]|uniref:hypothetical protein n=1 Tax=Aeromonas piscicola TaxID=600645 RepID=UPI0021F8C0E9|nr:hypothetical protein [Aeromonas piscicola]MCW0507036.1 hypothetical protein [Aeromonas piscicola]